MSLIQSSTALSRTTQQLTVTVVTQHQLQKLVDLRNKAREGDLLRLDILTLLEAGAWVEPGPLTARIDRYLRQKLCKKALIPVIGVDATEDLLRRVVPTAFREVVITRAQGS